MFELSWGTGAPHLGLIFHGDVFPASASEWKSKPFEARVVNGRLYGRGVLDDKGPLAMGLVSMAMAKELGLKPQKGKVLIIIGNGRGERLEGHAGVRPHRAAAHARHLRGLPAFPSSPRSRASSR